MTKKKITHSRKFSLWRASIAWIIQEPVYINHPFSHTWIRITVVCAGSNHRVMIIKPGCYAYSDMTFGKSGAILLHFPANYIPFHWYYAIQGCSSTFISRVVCFFCFFVFFFFWSKAIKASIITNVKKKYTDLALMCGCKKNKDTMLKCFTPLCMQFNSTHCLALNWVQITSTCQL